MPFEFNPDQSSKPTNKSTKPSFDFGIETADSKPADNSVKPSFDFGAEKPASKPTANKSTDKKKTNTASNKVSKSTSKPTLVSKSTSKSTPAKSNTSASKSSASSNRGKRAKSPKNPFQDKRVMIFAGVGIVLALSLIVAIASNFSSSGPAPEQTVQRQMTPEEARREKLRKLQAKYDAQYAAEKAGPKTEKQKLMADAESKLNLGDYRGAADTYVKIHQMDPTDGYPVTQLINIYRNKFHDRVQLEKWEQVNNDIAKGNLDQLHKRSEEKYNKTEH